jgi:DNA modification methylase
VLRVVEAKIASLQANARNPRRIRPRRLEQLMRTLVAERELLEARPLIVLMDGTVIGGNQRLAAAVALGWETIPAVFVELDEVRAAVWMFLDNRPFGEDDEDLAAELLAELAARGGDLDLTGFERSETDALLRRLSARERDPDAAIQLPDEEPVSKVGEVYELGRHRLMCGDATDASQVEELLAVDEPVLIATDPPYGVELDNAWRDRARLNGRARSGRAAGGETTAARITASNGHASTGILSDSRADWSAAYALVPSCLVLYVWHASAHACEVQAGLERHGFVVRQQLVWDKGLFALSRQHYHWRHEPCLYATRVGARVPWFGPANQSTVWEAPSPKMVAAAGRGRGDEKVDHPTQKPVLLFSRPIENHLGRGQVVYDPFAGSGSALIAAELTGRRCVAMELDPRCCDLIRARWEEFTGDR